MGFTSLPRKAQAYLCGVILLGLVAAGAVMFIPWPGSKGTSVEIVVFLLIALFMGGKKITLIRHIGNDDAVSMSLGFVITFAGMLRFGSTWKVAITGTAFARSTKLDATYFDAKMSTI